MLQHFLKFLIDPEKEFFENFLRHVHELLKSVALAGSDLAQAVMRDNISIDAVQEVLTT